jgi:hypothetical protein
MTSASLATTHHPFRSRATRQATAIVLAVGVGLAGLLVAGQAGLLPKAPVYRGDPAEQYRSPQVVGERFAARSVER